jgi:hypothetical protein
MMREELCPKNVPRVFSSFHSFSLPSTSTPSAELRLRDLTERTETYRGLAEKAGTD